MKFLTAVLFYIISTLSQNINSGEIIYTISFDKEKFKKEYQKKGFKKDNGYYNTLDNSEKVEASLFFTNTESFYEARFLARNVSKRNVTQIKAGGENKFYTNSSMKETLEQNCGSLGECFIIKEKFMEWELTQKLKIINGKTCYLAIGKEKFNDKEYDVFAWYDPSININFGPKKYAGLPGLIVELQEGMFFFKVKKIILNKKTFQINKPAKGKLISKEKFDKLLKETSEKFFGEN
jgi:GLPGLI family protein